jgi:hypothetical protein
MFIHYYKNVFTVPLLTNHRFFLFHCSVLHLSCHNMFIIEMDDKSFTLEGLHSNALIMRG